MECDGRLIIINTYGKCASTSFYKTLSNLDPRAKVFHVHGLIVHENNDCDVDSNKKSRAQEVIEDVKSELIYATKCAHDELQNSYDEKIVVIGMRDPYSYALSSFIENMQAWECGSKVSGGNVNSICRYFEKYVHNFINNENQTYEQKHFNELVMNTNNWMLNHLDFFGINICAKSMSDNGFQIIIKKDIKFIFYIFEMLHETEQLIIENIIGMRKELQKENITSENPYAECYKILQQEFIPPKRFIDILYDNTISREIYRKPNFNSAVGLACHQKMFSKLNRNVIRILQISPATFSEKSIVGGGEKIVLYINKALQKAASVLNTQILTGVCTLNGIPFSVYEDNVFESLTVDGITWDQYSININKLRDIIEEYDIIYVNQGLTSVGHYVAAQAKMLGKIVVGLDSGGGLSSVLFHDSNLLNCFDAFHAQSDFAKKNIPLSNTRTVTIKGPIDCDYYSPSIKKRDNYILTVGRVLPHKGLDVLLDALPPGVRLEVIGEVYDNEYYNYIKEKGKGKRVRYFHGMNDDEVKSKMTKARLFVHPSQSASYKGDVFLKSELLGMAPLEALSVGTQTIVSNVASLPELSIVTGCSVFKSVDDLKSQISDIFYGNAQSPRPQMLHDDVNKYYGLEQFGIKLLKTFEEILNAHSNNI